MDTLQEVPGISRQSPRTASILSMAAAAALALTRVTLTLRIKIWSENIESRKSEHVFTRGMCSSSRVLVSAKGLEQTLEQQVVLRKVGHVPRPPPYETSSPNAVSVY